MSTDDIDLIEEYLQSLPEYSEDGNINALEYATVQRIWFAMLGSGPHASCRLNHLIAAVMGETFLAEEANQISLSPVYSSPEEATSSWCIPETRLETCLYQEGEKARIMCDTILHGWPLEFLMTKSDNRSWCFERIQGQRTLEALVYLPTGGLEREFPNVQ